MRTARLSIRRPPVIRLIACSFIAASGPRSASAVWVLSLTASGERGKGRDSPKRRRGRSRGPRRHTRFSSRERRQGRWERGGKEILSGLSPRPPFSAHGVVSDAWIRPRLGFQAPSMSVIFPFHASGALASSHSHYGTIGWDRIRSPCDIVGATARRWPGPARSSRQAGEDRGSGWSALVRVATIVLMRSGTAMTFQATTLRIRLPCWILSRAATSESPGEILGRRASRCGGGLGAPEASPNSARSFRRPSDASRFLRGRMPANRDRSSQSAITTRRDSAPSAHGDAAGHMG